MICPHQKNIEQVNILGLIIYNHKDDGKSCDCLNRLDIKPDTIAERLFKNEYSGALDHTNKKIVALYSASREVRMVIYKQMSNQNPEQLIQTLLEIEEVVAASSFDGDQFYVEMIEVFGDNMLSNIKIVNGMDYTEKYQQKKAPVLSVYRLGIKDMKGRLYEQSDNMRKLEDIVDSIEESSIFFHTSIDMPNVSDQQYTQASYYLQVAKKMHVPPNEGMIMLGVESYFGQSNAILQHVSKEKE